MNPPRLGTVGPAFFVSVVYTSMSQWWFISTPQPAQIILTAILATAAILTFFRSVQRYLLTTLAQRLSHPDQFPEKFICAPDVGIIEESAVLGKHFLHAREIHIPQNRNQNQLSHHWQQVFDHSCAHECSSRDTHNADSLVNICLEATVQDMLYKAR